VFFITKQTITVSNTRINAYNIELLNLISKGCKKNVHYLAKKKIMIVETYLFVSIETMIHI